MHGNPKNEGMKVVCENPLNLAYRQSHSQTDTSMSVEKNFLLEYHNIIQKEHRFEIYGQF